MRNNAIVLLLLLLGSMNVRAYESTYDQIQWDKRGNDTFYCIDITDEKFQIHPWLQALSCGENLYRFSPKEYLNQMRRSNSLATGTRFGWRVWSNSGYGGTGYEGIVTVQSCTGQSYVSSSTNIQWGCRNNDSFYCIDILNSQGNFIKQAAMCNEGLHNFSPTSLNLGAGEYRWKVWSPAGYGGDGFEGQFSIAGTVVSPAANGKVLFNQDCAGCHRSPNNIREASNATSIRSAINGNKGGMRSLNFLTDAQLNDIAAYVQNPN
jgi:hypothetical protein